jgi:ectoine hydroxylase-related dioxygenase (phytanoyl-CoA dioxygenase family)
MAFDNYLFEKFTCTKETLEETIQKYGVAIIANVLDDRECQEMVSGIWDFLENITHEWEIPLNRDNKDSWRDFYKLYPMHSMLLQHWGVGHTQASWDVRQNMKIVELFAYFWKCDVNDLLVSFDGLSFGMPPEVTKKGWNRNNTWYHTDQSFTTPDFKCIQSWVTGIDVNEGDATLSFLEGSNKYHDIFKNKYGITDKSNWYKLTKEQQTFYMEQGCNIQNIKCPKGSMVFWDSRTIHCGIEASKNRIIPNIRAVIYLCYMPRNLCSKANLKKKQKAFNELRTTSHYPCNIKLFPKTPRTYGGDIPKIKLIQEPILNELGKTLAGF